jgi:hypothetical protein
VLCRRMSFSFFERPLDLRVRLFVFAFFTIAGPLFQVLVNFQAGISALSRESLTPMPPR